MRDLLTLLGLRCSEGSVPALPPSLGECVASFGALHTSTDAKIASKLTVGARALAKHAHRDTTTTWWGISSGSEAAKNAHAVEILRKVLSDVVWINFHQLPHALPTFEVRHRDGYGLRWVVPPEAATAVVFRGFLGECLFAVLVPCSQNGDCRAADGGRAREKLEALK